MDNVSKILAFIKIINQLKFELRFRGASYKSDSLEDAPDKADNVAAHSWRMTMMVWLIADELKINLNKEKCIKMSLVHDISEGFARDIAFCRILENPELKKQKDNSEPVAMSEMTSVLPDSIGKEIYDLWQEYSDAKTPEAKIVKIIDKLECVYQMIDMGVQNIKTPEAVATHSMKGFGWFPEMDIIMNKVRDELKSEFIKNNLPWLPRYDLGK